MSKVQYTVTGKSKFDYWEQNANNDWAIIPGGTIKGFEDDLPIRLQVGDASFGQKHIEKRHGHWLQKIKKSLQELITYKLSQSGTIFTTEDPRKIKITMRLSPDALLVLRYTNNGKESFFTIVTCYSKNGAVDGEKIGRYFSDFQTKNS